LENDSSVGSGYSQWPYEIQYDLETQVSADVLVLGGGLAGCYAAIGAARRGLKVALVDKSSVIHSGAAGVGIDHYTSCVSNPASGTTVAQFLSSKGAYDNYIAMFITAKESYEVLCELEEMGVKVRDTEDAFAGADFRDEETKLLFAYDYEARHTLRIWGTGLKPALYRECKRLGVDIYERIMVTDLLSENGRQGGKIIGAVGFDTRTGGFYVFSSKASVLSMSTPDRMWIFSSEWTGLVGRDGPPTNIGNGHAMAYRAGAEFARMEASSHEEWGGSTGIGSVLFGSGTTFATWFPCSIVDAGGKEIPWVDADGNRISTVGQRTHPPTGRRSTGLSLGGGEGGGSSFPSLIHDLTQRIQDGEYKLPLYADLPGMPKHERRAIFGLMVGQEGQTWPVYRNLTGAGYDPDKDLLQVYDLGDAPISWRRLRYGGLMHDWEFKTNLEGLYAAGQQIYDGCGCSNACVTGRWAGIKAANYARDAENPVVCREQVERLKKRVFAPLERTDGINWKELACGIAKVLQDYCGDMKTRELMEIGKLYLEEIQEGEAQTLFARNPHELMRAIETLDVLTCSKMILHASMARQASSKALGFQRLDYPENDPEQWKQWVVISLKDGMESERLLPLNYYGSLEDNYKKNMS
jgi:succinate dehydrogenase/fumarate reductase flavoprotein subunit